MYFMIGCATSREPVAPGTFTITGIPREYVGKLFSSTMKTIPDLTVSVSSIRNIAVGEETTAASNEIKLPVNIFKVFGKPNGYDGDGILDVSVVICDSVSDKMFGRSPTIVFNNVQFENGAAEVNWNNAIRAGSVTITNIPAVYKWQVQILIGQTTYPLGIAASIPYGNGTIINDTITVPILQGRDMSGYKSYTENGTKDILLSIQPPRSGETVTKNHQFLFRDVRITNGVVTIDFRQGVRQQ